MQHENLCPVYCMTISKIREKTPNKRNLIRQCSTNHASNQKCLSLF